MTEPTLSTNKSDIVRALSKDLQRFKGQILWFTLPIKIRISEMLTGSRSDLSLKRFGDNIEQHIEKSSELEKILRDILGCADLACAGGIVGLWFREMPISISAAVGFITLSGVSVLNSMLVVSYLRGNNGVGSDRDENVLTAWLTCLRTVVLTAIVASVGFIPMATSLSTGAEVQRPLATVVISGVIASCLMTLFVLPVLYSMVPWRPTKGLTIAKLI